MGDARVTQGTVLTVLNPDNADALRITQGTVLAIYGQHSEIVRSSQEFVNTVVSGTFNLRVTQGTVLVLWRGRRENRKLRAWPFSLDGHDFYVLRLGEDHTLVLDLTTGQWSRWTTPGLEVWRAHLGLNWQGVGANVLDSYAWNIIGGDDDSGILWNVDPNEALDTDIDGNDVAFTRKAMGMIPMRLREGRQVGAVYMIGNLCSPALTGDGITLKTSDDQGVNWTDHGTVTASTTDTYQEIGWLGLGLITAPGRLFLLEDTGAFARISSLDMRD